ncbi:MAG: HAAS signaling domain-containing protein [Thermoplasmatota archaeon]
MSADDRIKLYMKKIENSLNDVDKKRRKAILEEIRDNIDDKISEYLSTNDSKKLMEESEIETILDNFGDPEEIALNYKMHLTGNFSAGKMQVPWKPIIITAVIILMLLSVFIATMFFISVDNEDNNNSIFIGKGLERVDLNDGRDEIINEYGVPEEREETDTTLWISYRSQYGLDFLLARCGDHILEIRINMGFEGKTEEGIGIGDDLDNVFLNISEPLLSVDVDWDDAHRNARGGDRVLYNQMEGGGNVMAFKYIDQKKGVLFWADSDRKITQIVIFEPIEVDVINMECDISSASDTVVIEILFREVEWDRFKMMVDGKYLETNVTSADDTNTAIFFDPDGELDAVINESYNVKIIDTVEDKVVWQDDIIAS